MSEMQMALVPRRWLVPSNHTRCDTEVSFRAATRVDLRDDTCRLVYADWLDEQDRQVAASRLRWWVDARAKVRAGVVWDRSKDWAQVDRSIAGIKAEWVRRLYAVEIGRIIREKYPLASEFSKITAIADDTLFVAEEFALLLATEEELSAAWSAAWSAAESAARSAAGSAAGSAARSAAWSAAWSAAESAARSAAESAAWSAARSAAESAAWSAARSAAESAARSAAESAAWSAARSAAESAAWSAARSAAESAAWSAARSAAESAAESAAWSAAEIVASLKTPEELV